MIFNSLQFVFFFIIVLIVHFQLGHRYRWAWLLFVSCYFYMAFIPLYILILFLTISIDYLAGIQIEKSRGRMRTVWLVSSLIANIGILAIFKYFNLAVLYANKFASLTGIGISLPFLDWVLPIGLSFHTFQAMSYTIEVYRANQKAERHFGIYALFVMFFPQLVAGPIERPQNLLHQYHAEHPFNGENLKLGLQMMLFGFLKKTVIADRLAIPVDFSFANSASQGGLALLLACVLYSFQIYCDFSGYSDIARGAAKTLGYELMENFNMPYLASSLSEFWKRWHISLSTWFRDYLYIPLGGNRNGLLRTEVNLLIVFAISGLWHGAKNTFIIWGLLHGVMLIAANTKRRILQKYYGREFILPQIARVVLTFTAVSIAWVFFRAGSLLQAKTIFGKILRVAPATDNDLGLGRNELAFSILLIILLLVAEKFWHRGVKEHTRFFWAFAPACIIVIYFFGVFRENQFIYFQF